ncbi:putative enzyme related to lactoylglutathione lyase [Actinoplanes octamycinicus]|uniref:Putative enzyme related to lactoylglutathione lyase n=1 Tax=Actinoplanes octamycinicus TaxID=135948 RepID=A0A7W7H2G2_9ACTN|nr:VOC family protein [Actinoplanes octamycinicus]MBB4742760.1 putative enzyme related to lactoylglutathione lyase [Actinoplanes octamycinicus]GIE58385.1 hypothetical protein Aoc01nite_37870 [Actinoplanes octamycinicus]
MQTRERMLPYVTVYIDVLDMDAALETISGLGGSVMVPPTRINDSLSFALFRDPAGNAVGLLQGEALTAA